MSDCRRACLTLSRVSLTGRQVQRSSEPVEEVSEGATGWGPPGGKDPDAPDKDAAGYDEEVGDSKAMKLTLMEEVLLLGLKDREVSGVFIGDGSSVTTCPPGLHLVLE